jgi:signal transduction histidine kinase
MSWFANVSERAQRRAPHPQWGRFLDGASAVLLFALMSFELAVKPLQPQQQATTPIAYLLAALITLPIAVHRRHPLAALAVSSLSLIAYAAGHFAAFPGYASFGLMLGISLHADRRRAAAGFLISAAALSIALALQPKHVVTASSWVSTLLALTVVWLGGEYLKARRARRLAAVEAARQQELDRERRARSAVTEERLRIARDLHDVVAHSMSVIAVQAGVAHHVIDDRPELARQALGTIETTTRQALVEMRRLLGVLRQGDDSTASLAPVPGLSEVPELIRQFGAAGLDVLLQQDGTADGIPPGVDLSAYRIVQEGLTNVLRHGGPQARITIAYPAGGVVLEISNDNRRDGAHPRSARPAGPEPGRLGGTGHGLTGMRERVAVFGGQFEAGPTPEGGFRLWATLPFGDPARVAVGGQR